MRQLITSRYNKPTALLLVVLACCALSGCEGGISIEDLRMLMTPLFSNCWPCSMYKIVFDAIASVLNASYTTMSQLSLLLLGIGLLFWLAFKVTVMASSLKQPNIRDFVTSMFGTLFKGLAVAVILSSPAYTMEVLDMIATPVLSTFIHMAKTVLFADPTIAKNFVAPQAISFGSTGAPLLTGEIGYEVQDIVYRIYVALQSGMVLGFRMFIGIDLVAYIMGLVIIVAFFFLMVVFPLLFIDSFVRLGAVFIFFPLLLAAWVFPSTKKYIGEGWKMLFGAMMQILVACVYIALIINIVKSYSDAHSLSRQLSDPLILLGLKTASNEAIGFLALAICMMKLTDKIPAMAGYFGGDATKSEMVKAFANTGRMSVAMGKMAAGGIVAGMGLGWDAGKKLFTDSAEELKKQALSGGQGLADWEYGGQEQSKYISETDIWNGNSDIGQQARQQRSGGG